MLVFFFYFLEILSYELESFQKLVVSTVQAIIEFRSYLLICFCLLTLLLLKLSNLCVVMQMKSIHCTTTTMLQQRNSSNNNSMFIVKAYCLYFKFVLVL